jgi:hypothetical protein
MKPIIPILLLLLSAFACKNKPAPTQNDLDQAAITETIHKFAQWASDFANNPSEDHNFLDMKGKFARLDSALLNRYLAKIKASGLVSDTYINSERAYYQKCEPFWQNENKDEILTGMDDNRFFHAQDYDLKQWTTTPVNVVEGLGTDEVTATMNSADSTPFVTYTLEKQVDKWLINSLEISDKSFIETEDYAGSYYSDDKSCSMELHISLKNGMYVYQLKTAKRNNTGTISIKRPDTETYLTFNGLRGSEKTDMEALFSKNSILFQNYGNAMNKYLQFKECNIKYINLIKGPKKRDKPDATPAPVTDKTTAKPAPAKKVANALPTITINRYGDITLGGKKIALEDLRKALQKELLTRTVIPDQILIKPIGEVGVGARHELQTVVLESIAGAKWVRKKAALEAVNLKVSNRLNANTQLELNNFQTISNLALVDARPLYTNGNPID